MQYKKETPIVLFVGRALSPFIMLFGLYVLFHGHYSPGGGFQGGALLAASVILIRLTAGYGTGQIQFRKGWGIIFGAIGVLIYFGTGVISLAYGGNFLDYGSLPLPFDQVMRRYYGILIIEVGVALAVMGVLVSIYDYLLEGDQDA